MKRIILIIGLVFIILISVLRCNIPLTNSKVIGTYLNTNYGNKHFIAEIPYKADTLVLKSDGTFSSGFYGNGTYQVDCGILKTEIDLDYDYVMGNARSSFYFSNKVYENTKIILNYDLNHYYEKID